jgi:lysozyme
MNKFQKVEALMARPVKWPIHRDAVRLIATSEDCYLVAYLCPAKVWTCGWGETDGVRQGTRWTQEHADERFRMSLEHFADEVLGMLKQPASEHQLGALVSLAYNIGLGALRKSTVLRLHNAGDFAGAARAFGLWNKARVNGALTPLAGLTSRRAAEAALYLHQDPEAPSERMPQAVQPESKIVASPIAQGGAITVATGAALAGEQIAAVAPIVKQARELAVDTVGVPADWFLPIVLVAAGAAALWWRYKQRQGGWA